MISKLVQKSESIEFAINGKFIFCKELKKGFVKTNLDGLNLDDYSFENVVSVIEGLDYNSIVAAGVNSVEFIEGEIGYSQRTEEKLKSEIFLLAEESRADFIVSRRSLRRYFNEANLVETVSNTSQMIV